MPRPLRPLCTNVDVDSADARARADRHRIGEGAALWPELSSLATVIGTAQRAEHAGAGLATLLAQGVDDLPMPGAGAGATLRRWQVLAMVAEHDLSLVKLFEAHTDALAILRELQSPLADTAEARVWAVWAAEAPGARVTFDQHGGNTVRLHGTKAWCSGARDCTHALLTAWAAPLSASKSASKSVSKSSPLSSPQLVSVRLADPGVSVSAGPWCAIGMPGSPALQVDFDGVVAERVGGPGDYLSRPGFWHGGAGVAACWYGGTLAIANTLRRAMSGQSTPATHRAVALGKVDVVLAGAAALLRECADWIDQHPDADAAAWALRVRLATESAAQAVLDEVGRALGAGAFCQDRAFAQAAADLPVFVRQSHAERDYAALAGHLVGARVGDQNGDRVGHQVGGAAGSWAL